MKDRDATSQPFAASLDRRNFLRATTATLVTTAFGTMARPIAASDTPEIRVRRRLGRTNLEISDISYGSSRTADPEIVRHALARGINYFDTAESYKSGASEESCGVALRDHREKVILASKTKCSAGSRRAELMRALEDSLRRLGTDRIEIYFNHAVNDIDRLQNDEWYAFAEEAKAQGKIRFTGMSGHGGKLVECIDYAVANDLVDVLLVGYNFGQDPAFYQRFIRNFDFVAPQTGLTEALDRARKKDIGVIAMKTLRGARLNDMRPFEYGGATTAQAAFRWTLGGGHVDALIVSMTSREQIDEYVAASGGARPTAAEVDWLDRYLASAPEGYCEHGCNLCESSCPAGVAIPEVLRTRMYARDYGDMALARADYARLEANAAPCIGCTAPCTGACPAGIELGSVTRATHRELT
jgi:predicted aldo/keto reductase-like oxidoreductase